MGENDRQEMWSSLLCQFVMADNGRVPNQREHPVCSRVPARAPANLPDLIPATEQRLSHENGCSDSDVNNTPVQYTVRIPAKIHNSESSQTNVPVSNGAQTNVPLTNGAPTNVPLTNDAQTNAPVSNGAQANVAATSVNPSGTLMIPVLCIGPNGQLMTNIGSDAQQQLQFIPQQCISAFPCVPVVYPQFVTANFNPPLVPQQNVPQGEAVQVSKERTPSRKSTPGGSKSKRNVRKSEEKCSLTKEQLLAQREKCMGFVRECGFYHGTLSMEDARRKLKKAPIGSFLLRDSSDEKFFLSLSVKTERGTTSIRISDSSGKFRLDCETRASKRMASFDCVLKLIEHYVESAKLDKANACVFLESSGRKDTPLLLLHPFLSQPRSLKHSCRLLLNQLLDEDRKQRVLLFMPPDVERLMSSYQYKI